MPVKFMGSRSSRVFFFCQKIIGLGIGIGTRIGIGFSGGIGIGKKNGIGTFLLYHNLSVIFLYM